MPKTSSILVVDDEESICRLLQKELATPQRRVDIAFTATDALARCRQESFEVVILDIRLPDGNGLDLLFLFLSLLPDAKIIMITGYADVDETVIAMRNGAYDFVTKPFTLEKLELTVERALAVVQLERENRSLRLSSNSLEQPLIGHSAAMAQVFYLIEKVAPTDVPVLITGDSGTGKDVVAAALHQASLRRGQPFVVKNCASLQPELARSELFGHVKGAFTNALTASEGLMTFANKGTLFLDEVGELSPEVQAQLLRVLESHRYRRVGEKEERRTDVRFLFATNRNLTQEVLQGRFHEALFHRINVFQINLPPLKERKDDIPLLVRHFLAQLSQGKKQYTLNPQVMHHLLHYDWPGNIRELRNVIERGMILAENGIITEKSLPAECLVPPSFRGSLHESVDNTPPSWGPPPVASALPAAPAVVEPPPDTDPATTEETGEESLLPLKHIEREHIARVLHRAGGNKHQAAQLLGISRKTLYRKLAKMEKDGVQTHSSP